jgi:hypothetical protein
VLKSGLARNDDGARELFIPRGKDMVSLRAYLYGSGHKRYRALLQTPEGEQVANREMLKVKLNRSRLIIVTLPAKLLADRDYVLTVSGISSGGRIDEVGKYYFRVIRQ